MSTAVSTAERMAWLEAALAAAIEIIRETPAVQLRQEILPLRKSWKTASGVPLPGFQDKGRAGGRNRSPAPLSRVAGVI